MQPNYLPPVFYYIVDKTTLTMCSERPRGVNLTQWHQLSAEDKFEGGPSHETCCTLCGVPFFIYLAPLDDGPEVSEDTLVWSTYFFARK